MWLFFGGIVLLVYAGINIYTGFNVLQLFKYFLPSSKAFIFWPIYFLFCYSFLFILFLRFDRFRPLRQAAMYVLPFLVYFCFALVILDGLRFGLRFFGHFSLSPGFSAAGTGIALCLVILAMVYGTFHARDIRTVHYNVTLNKSGTGQPGQVSALRLVLVSDLHIGTTVDRKWVANIVDTVNKAGPDIICIAGDIFDNDFAAVRNLDGIGTELRRLKAPLGVYACPGNHDVDRISLRQTASGGSASSAAGGSAGNDRIREFLKKEDIVYLEDELRLVNDSFYLVGRKDARPIGLRQERKSAAELTADLDKSRPVIFLDHEPVDFPREEAAGADLILSGHTHRGQFCPGNIITAEIYKRAGAVSYGYWQGHTAQGVVSSGAGLWGPPIRIGTDSEAAVLDIVFREGERGNAQ